MLEHLAAAPRSAVWRWWTERVLIKRRFTPAPWTTRDASTNLRLGGGRHDESGINSGVVPGRRLVFTDANLDDRKPTPEPFFTVIGAFEDGPSGPRYTARARHWRAKVRASHEAMGFHGGWGKAAYQLEALARTL